MAVVARTPAEEAARLRKELGQGLCVCILGADKFSEPGPEELVKALARELEKSVGATEAFFVTTGLSGVQECFAKNCGDGSRVHNLLPEGKASDYGVGKDVHAGANPEERQAIFAQLGDVYITIEGGPEVSRQAAAAKERGATVLPLIRSGAACIMNEIPDFAKEEQSVVLKKKNASADETAVAVAALVKDLAGKHNASVWDLMDELLGFSRSTLVKALGVVIGILMLISCSLIFREISRGDSMMALLHGGFLFLLLGLVASVAWVVYEATRLEEEKKEGGAEALEEKPKDASAKKAE